MLLLLAPAPAPNLVSNPSFEDGAAPWSLPATYTVDTTQAHTGKASLRVDSRDAARYLLAGQRVACQPGRLYEVSVWVKTEQVTGEDSGATVCLEWSNAQGGYLGGSYPAGHKGTTDWVRVRAVAGPLPPEAASVSVTVYLRKGMVGRAWFDDVDVHEVLPPPMTLRMVRPAYRGRFVAGTASAAMLEVAVAERQAGDRDLGALALRYELKQGDRVVQQGDLPLPQRLVDVRVPLSELKVGRYDLDLVLTAKADGQELARQSRRLEAVDPAAPRPKVFIDDLGRTMVEGQPFFPLGLYDSRCKPADLKRMAEAGFNCVMPYGINSTDLSQTKAYLDAAQAAGLKVIYSIKDFYDGTTWRPKQVGPWKTIEDMTKGVVSTFKDHPALLAWYLNDELPLSMHGELEARYRAVRDLDPDHPCWVVLYQVESLPGYVDTTDVLGTDPYPIPDPKRLAMAGQWTRRTVAAVGPYGGVWQVPQAHDTGCYVKDVEGRKRFRAPTLTELRNMTFQCLAEGARGLIYYSYFDLQRDPLGFDRRWADMRALADELRGLIPFVLSDEAPLPAGVSPAGAPPVAFARIWQHQGRFAGVAANAGLAAADFAWRLPGRAPKPHGEATAFSQTAGQLAPGQAISFTGE